MRKAHPHNNNMRFLITGLTGFAGPHLANLLHKEGHEVCGIVRGTNGRENDIRDVVPDEVFDKITWFWLDFFDRTKVEDLFRSEKFDGVFHLGAQSHPPSSFEDPHMTYEMNVMGSINLIEAVVRHQPNCKFMFCSTSEVYGDTCPEGGILHEINSPVLPSNPYGNSKAAIDLYMQERMTNGKLKGFVTRAFSHTGPRRGQKFSISSDAFQLARIKKGFQENTLNVGNLEATRVVIDVRDCVRAYYLLMMTDKSNGLVFNVCGDVPLKMRVYAEKLIEIAGVDCKQYVHPKLYRPIDINYQHGDTQRLKKIAGWEPVYTLDQTLTDLFNYWMDKI
jgi:GDP-4-dehydro-6-deoxy-D-mannose reductase